MSRRASGERDVGLVEIFTLEQQRGLVRFCHCISKAVAEVELGRVPPPLAVARERSERRLRFVGGDRDDADAGHIEKVANILRRCLDVSDVGVVRFLRAEWKNPQSRFVLIRYAVSDKEEIYGLLLDLDKKAILDDAGDADTATAVKARAEDIWRIVVNGRFPAGEQRCPVSSYRPERKGCARHVDVSPLS